MKTPLAISLTIAGLCVLSSVSDAAFTVVNNGATSYTIDGASNPTLTLNQGSTYTFNVSATGHPFWIKTQRITGSGSAYSSGVTNNGVQSGTLTWVVPTNAPSQLFYQCGVHSAMGGTINILGPVGVTDRPSTTWLGRAIPNPARKGASFRFGLPRNSEIDVAMFDVRGRRVRTLWHGAMDAGQHTLTWDGLTDRLGAAPSGAYFYRLRVDGRVLSGRLLLTR